MGARNPVASCGLHILVNEAAEPVRAKSLHPAGTTRLHGELGLIPPVEYEALHNAQTRAR